MLEEIEEFLRGFEELKGLNDLHWKVMVNDVEQGLTRVEMVFVVQGGIVFHRNGVGEDDYHDICCIRKTPAKEIPTLVLGE